MDAFDGYLGGTRLGDLLLTQGAALLGSEDHDGMNQREMATCHRTHGSS